MADELTFEFEDMTFDEVEATRRKKTAPRDSTKVLKDWLTAFANSGKPIAGKYTFLRLPDAIVEAYKPRQSEKGNRVLGGMAAVVRGIKSVQDELDVFPVPMDDPAVHALNTELGEDITPDDPRYGGFVLVKKTAWIAFKNPTKDEKKK